MNDQTVYMNFPDLATRIGELVGKLHTGSINSAELEELTNSTLALYDRLVVIRYNTLRKAIAEETSSNPDHSNTAAEEYPDSVAAVAENNELQEPMNTAVNSDDSLEEELNELREEIEHEVEMPGGSNFQLNFTQISPNQISLIDSIEEISKEEKTRNESFEQDSPTLARKLQHAPIADLKTAIGINQKFAFISELFENDSAKFDKAIIRLNSFSSYLEADDYIENSLKESYGWDMKSKTVRSFIELVHRRYL